MKKVFVFNEGFLTDYTDGLGVVFANTRMQAIQKMAILIVMAYGDNEYGVDYCIKKLSELHIDEYEMDKFPGVFIYGGA